MLLVTFFVLIKIVALLLAYHQAQLNVFNVELEWGVDLAPLGSVLNSLSAKFVLVGEKLIATYSISTEE